MNNKRALISGISGQDGAYLAKLLLGKGYQVFGTARDAQMASFRNLETLGIRQQVTLLSMALNDFRSVLQTLSKAKPDEVYNLAGQSSVGLSFEQPVETLESISIGTLNLLEAIRFLQQPIRLYSAGSSECFGDTGGAPADETTSFHPRSPYAVAKSAAHWEVANYREAYSLFACTGILFNHESPLRPERFVTRKIISAACRIAAGSGEKLQLGNISIARDWGLASEYVDAMWRMLQQDDPRRLCDRHRRDQYPGRFRGGNLCPAGTRLAEACQHRSLTVAAIGDHGQQGQSRKGSQRAGMAGRKSHAGCHPDHDCSRAGVDLTTHFISKDPVTMSHDKPDTVHSTRYADRCPHLRGRA